VLGVIMLPVRQVVDELLSHGVDVNQSLTHGLGNAMCVATLPVCESNRSPALRIALVRRPLCKN